MVFRLLYIAALLLAVSGVTAAEAVNDVRVVIDTSGSMKQTDPENLRIPALKLLVHLLPAGTQAGVWLFDEKVQALLPPGAVDAGWKKKAEAAAAKIHSRGLFTNIEAALATAAKDWTGAPPDKGQRSIILLTDGKLDVSKKPEESAASRERLIKELLPKLQLSGARIHTIALSEQSDQELLRQISLASNGWNETVLKAEALERAFAQMLNQAAPQESVPLEGNAFKVDKGIKEFTVLVLLRPDAKATKLVNPKGAEIAQAHAPEGTHWVHEAGYDLITVSHPEAGEWKLVADSDPANRVLVVTDLKMDVTPLPAFLTRAELTDIAAAFTEDGKPIDREDFLNLLALKAELSGMEHPQELPMPRDGAQYKLHLDPATPNGAYTLTVTADGQTFKRQAKQTFQILDEPVRVETTQSHETGAYTITLTPDGALVDPASLVVSATTANAEGHGENLEGHPKDHAWQFEVASPQPGQKLVVNFTATAKSTAGEAMDVPLKPVVIESAAQATPDHEPAPAQEGEHAAAEPPAAEHGDAHAEPPAEPAAPPAAENPPNWPRTAAIVAGIDVFLFIAGWLIFRWIRKRNEAVINRLLSKLST